MRIWLLLALALSLAAACGGDGEQERESVGEAAPSAAEQQVQDEAAPAQAEDPAEAQTAAQTEAATQVEQAAPADQGEQQAEAVGSVRTGVFNPDEADLRQLIYWGPADGFFGTLLPIPASGLTLISQLLNSSSPAADKYVVDLAAFPNPYRDQVMSYLARRYGTELQRTIYDYPQIFEFDPSDSDTLAYRRFKQALIGGQFPDMARMLEAEAERTIDTREVAWGGVRVDGIPPLETPTQIAASEAVDWMNDTDQVVGIEINGDARAYPVRIIAWHEMVNDTIGGAPVSLAYCTLCGSAILYDGRAGSEVYRFGTSGLLYRSNKLMYDRTTRTLWNQFSGRPAIGPLVGSGIELEVLPVVVTTWAEWLKRHPDTLVLDIETGYHRDYGPGVAYDDYNSSPLTWFNVPISDDRLGAKDEVYVVRSGGALTAYPTPLLAERGLVQDEVGGVEVVVVATADGAGGRSYETGGRVFESVDVEMGTLTDVEGGVWVVGEDGLAGPSGEVLARVSGHNAFWFGVINQMEGARLFEG